MAHPGSVTGTLIPDGGDPHQTSDELHSEYLDALEVHRHTGEPGDYNPIQAAGLAIDDDVPWNENGITELGFLTFIALDTATMPINSLARDVSGNLYWRPSAGSAVQITSGSALNVSGGNGWVGLSTPARATYSPADGFYEVFEDFGNNLRGRFASAGLRLRERVNSPGNYCDIVLPSGWDAAAGADPTINIPQQSDISAITNPIMMLGLIGTWSAVVRIGGADQTTVVNRARYTRVFDRVWVDFNLNWSGGPASGAALTIGGLPFAASATLGAVGTPLQAHSGGTPLVTVPRALSASTIMELIDVNTGLNVTDNSLAGGNVAGTFCYFI